MITVEEAFELIDQQIVDFGFEEIVFQDCLGRVVAEDIVADRDFPPYHRAAMDGIAILHADFDKGIRDYKIVGQQIAGISQQALEGEATCIEIMTGAILPAGADTIIRYEDTEIVEGQARVNLEGIHQGANVHIQGKDCEKGVVMIPKGKTLNIGDLGIIASVGKEKLKVKKLPKVAVISTGDELVEVGDQPKEYQIRKSNVHTIAGLLQKQGIEFTLHHFDDDFDVIKSGLEEIVQHHQVIMMSGGVSMGKKDFIPEALEAIGVKKHFHRVKQRPGKPLWFGSNEKVTVFGFPGNPVSTLVCYTAYFKRWLQKSTGLTVNKTTAQLSVDVEFKPDLFYFMPVSLQFEGATLTAAPQKGHGSGDLVNLSKMDGFICFPKPGAPKGKDLYRAGESFEIIFPV